MTTTPFALPEVSDDDLLALEVQIQAAQRARSLDGLKVFGFGEVSIATGWPTTSPRFVAKRILPLADTAQVDAPLDGINTFTERLRANGGGVLPFQTRRVQRPDGLHVAYVVQPIVPVEDLAETVLTTDTPSVGHPLLVAVRDYVMDYTEPDMAFDGQIPNFAWRDGRLWLLDITSPATFDDAGRLRYPNMHMSKQLVPAPLRPVIAKASADVFTLYHGKQNALTQIVVFLNRVGAEAWIDPAIATFNEVLDTPIDRREVDERWKRNVKDFPKIKKLLTLQRAWQENVRRTPYEYLITDSFTGEVI